MRKADVSFEELYNCYKVRFERFAISYIQDRSVAEDIVTDSFVYWWEHRDRVGSKDENPAAYILATIRHKCLNHLRALGQKRVPMPPAMMTQYLLLDMSYYMELTSTKIKIF